MNLYVASGFGWSQAKIQLERLESGDTVSSCFHQNVSISCQTNVSLVITKFTLAVLMLRRPALDLLVSARLQLIFPLQFTVQKVIAKDAQKLVNIYATWNSRYIPTSIKMKGVEILRTRARVRCVTERHWLNRCYGSLSSTYCVNFMNILCFTQKSK